ncbi:MAG: hypothetical protein Tsb002_08230 [Wenzhouxiangellaceae bacterium]
MAIKRKIALTVSIGVFFLYSCALLPFDSIKGPGFFNASNDEVEIVANYKEGPPFRVKIPARTLFSNRSGYTLRAIEVYKGGKLTFRMPESQVEKLAQEIKETHRQIWVLEKDRGCLIRSKDFDKLKTSCFDQ